VASEREVRIDAVLERCEPKLAEMPRRAAGRLPGKVRERRSSPERQRLAQAFRRNRRLRTVRIGDETAKAIEVELVGRDAERVAGRARLQTVAELFTQTRHVVL
jgi:hypothetical protein